MNYSLTYILRGVLIYPITDNLLKLVEISPGIMNLDSNLCILIALHMFRQVHEAICKFWL